MITYLTEELEEKMFPEDEEVGDEEVGDEEVVEEEVDGDAEEEKVGVDDDEEMGDGLESIMPEDDSTEDKETKETVEETEEEDEAW